MKKYLLGLAVLAGIAAGAVIVRPARAIIIAPTDIYGAYLNDGDLISANQTAGDPDIFIVKLKPTYGPAGEGDLNGYKRLFLNPAIFNMYGHLGGYARVRQVTTGVLDSFETSGLFRNCETGDQKVWATEVTGEDDGILHHVQMTGDQAYREDSRFFDKVFCINSREERFYAKSIAPYYRLADVPRYWRRMCHIRPACLDSEPRCLLPEPVEGWCPKPTLTPPPGCYYQQIQCVTTPCNPVLVCPSPAPTCYPLPACAYPGANPVCDLTATGPDGRPWCPPSGSGPTTISSVRISSEPGIGGERYQAKVTGYLPTPCYSLTTAVATTPGIRRFSISFTATSTLGPDQGACVQQVQEFTREVPLAVSDAIDPGTYEVYVNGTYWASFVSPTAY